MGMAFLVGGGGGGGGGLNVGPPLMMDDSGGIRAARSGFETMAGGIDNGSETKVRR